MSVEIGQGHISMEDGVDSVLSEQLHTWVGEVRLVAADDVGDVLLTLGELLHVVGHDRLCTGRVHDGFS